MKRDQLFVLLLLLYPTLAYANEGKPKKWWSTPLIIVIYVGFFLLAAGVALCIRHYHDRRRLNGRPRTGEERRGLDAEEIESLPSLRFSEMKMKRLYKEGGGDQEQDQECAVCLSEFKDQEVLRILPDCFHLFHPSCIGPWLTSHLTCPICRSSLEHRQGSSVSMSSIFDGISGPLSQRFGLSGYHQHDDHDHDHDHDHDDDDHVTVIDIEGSSSNSHSEANLDDNDAPIRVVTKLQRSYSTGDLKLFPKEISPKSDYHRTTGCTTRYLSCISSKSDRFVDYSSLMLLIGSPSHVTGVSDP